MLSRTSRAIPQDIIDNIVAYLSHDPDSLRKCALVSHSFLSPSRRGLFSSIRVPSRRRPPPSLEHVQNLLSANPEIFNFIQKLNFSRLGSTPADRDFLKSFLLERLIFHRNVRVLSITGYPDIDTQRLILDLCRSCPIHTVKLTRACGFTSLLHVLGTIPTLRHLEYETHDSSSHCHNCGWLSTDPVPECEQPPALRGQDQQDGVYLKTLIISGMAMHRFVDQFLLPDYLLRVSRLRELCVSASGRMELEALNRVLGLGGPAIESFMWKGYDGEFHWLLSKPES